MLAEPIMVTRSSAIKILLQPKKKEMEQNPQPKTSWDLLPVNIDQLGQKLSIQLVPIPESIEANVLARVLHRIR